MQSFASLATLSALLASTAFAVCTPAATGDDDCAETIGTTVESAFATYGSDYTWQFVDVVSGNYDLRMIRIVGDETSTPVLSTEGPLLFLHTATQDCTSWLTNSASKTEKAIPIGLYDSGYDVYLGCRRGTTYSRDNATNNPDTPASDAKIYWDFDTQDIGDEDIRYMLSAILDTEKGAGADCSKVQIIAHSYGTAEALAYVAGNTASKDYVSNIISLAPCVIPSYLAPDYSAAGSDHTHNAWSWWSHWRMLEDALEIPEDMRELHSGVEDAVEQSIGEGRELDEIKGRELGYYYNSYWDRTASWCYRNGDSCNNYCSWYPSYCDEFCYWLPQYCGKKEITNQCELNALYEQLDIYSFYGPNFSTQVASICANVGYYTCQAFLQLKTKVYAEMSVKQLDHMFQNAYSFKFAKYSDSFCTNFASGTSFDLTDADFVSTETIYVNNDTTCDVTQNKAILGEGINSTGSVTTFTDDIAGNASHDHSITHSSIQGANDDYAVKLAIKSALLPKTAVTDCSTTDTFTAPA